MGKKFDISPTYDYVAEIVEALKKREIYSENLLYRHFRIKRDKTKRVREILRNGTDRTNQNNSRFPEIAQESDPRLEKRRRSLKPIEYIWACTERALEDEIDNSEEDGILFVSVYDENKMYQLQKDLSYEFKDQENRKDALVALIELHESINI